MYSYYIQKFCPYHVRNCTLIPLCDTLNPFLLGTEQENIIFLCGKQRKDNKFWGISWGWSPRDILRNLSSFLSFLHKNVILFKVLRTRICILVLKTFILLSSRLSFFSSRVSFFSSRVSFFSLRLSFFPSRLSFFSLTHLFLSWS